MHEQREIDLRPGHVDANATLRLGIIGGGQLARMTAAAALPLGVDVVVFERNPHSPAARLSPDCVVGDWMNRDSLLRFAGGCETITLENEFVDARALEWLEQAGHTVHPGSRCIAVCQDKLAQKLAMEAAGLTVPRYRAVASPDEVVAAGKGLGWPMVLKTPRNGYDGKGNYTMTTESDVPAAWEALRGDGNELMVEAWFPFVQELAVIVTRGRDGGMAVYPVVETIQRNHICHLVRAPALIPRELALRASGMAQRAVEAVHSVGSFGVEMFLGAGGELAINELAPRVHNSGHYTIEACACSQFENHVRAVLGWPLGDTRMIAPAAVMVNLLGVGRGPGRPSGLQTALAVPGARVHIYGKATSQMGRKMGHVTALGETHAAAERTALRCARELQFGTFQ